MSVAAGLLILVILEDLSFNQKFMNHLLDREASLAEELYSFSTGGHTDSAISVITIGLVE